MYVQRVCMCVCWRWTRDPSVERSGDGYNKHDTNQLASYSRRSFDKLFLAGKRGRFPGRSEMRVNSDNQIKNTLGRTDDEEDTHPSRPFALFFFGRNLLGGALFGHLIFTSQQNRNLSFEIFFLSVWLCVCKKRKVFKNQNKVGGKSFL